MVNLIVLIILLGSILGMAVIVVRKIPVLAKITPEDARFGFFSRLRSRINTNKIKESIPFEFLLHKFLSKIRVFFLKMENKVGGWLGKLRQRMIRKKNGNSDNYWQKLKGDEEKDENGPM